MYYVYILRIQKNKSLYTGFTSNLKTRIRDHNQGKALSTKHKRPYKLIFYECFLNKADAKNREQYLKTGWGRRSIKKMLKETFS